MTFDEIQRLMRIIDNICGIDNVALLPMGDVGQACENEFGMWLNTPQGKFEAYYAERESR